MNLRNTTNGRFTTDINEALKRIEVLVGGFSINTKRLTLEGAKDLAAQAEHSTAITTPEVIKNINRDFDANPGTREAVENDEAVILWALIKYYPETYLKLRTTLMAQYTKFGFKRICNAMANEIISEFAKA